MNYIINKTLIGVLLLTVVAVLLTATQVNAQTECTIGAYGGEEVHDADLNETPHAVTVAAEGYSVKHRSDENDETSYIQEGDNVDCGVIHFQFYVEIDGEKQNIGRKGVARARNNVITINLPRYDWTTSFEGAFLGITIMHPYGDDTPTDQFIGTNLSYDASKRPKKSETSVTKTVGGGSGGLRPGYITCLVAERDGCGTMNPEARTMIGMRTETPAETVDTQETAPAATQKSTVVRVEEDTTETNERPTETVIAQNDSADSNDSEETSSVPQLKYQVSKRGRRMTEIDHVG